MMHTSLCWPLGMGTACTMPSPELSVGSEQLQRFSDYWLPMQLWSTEVSWFDPYNMPSLHACWRIIYVILTHCKRITCRILEKWLSLVSIVTAPWQANIHVFLSSTDEDGVRTLMLADINDVHVFCSDIFCLCFRYKTTYSGAVVRIEPCSCQVMLHYNTCH